MRGSVVKVEKVSVLVRREAVEAEVEVLAVALSPWVPVPEWFEQALSPGQGSGRQSAWLSVQESVIQQG